MSLPDWTILRDLVRGDGEIEAAVDVKKVGKVEYSQIEGGD